VLIGKHIGSWLVAYFKMNCDKIKKPEFTKAQIAECQGCKHASGKKIWCCLFGIPIGKPLAIIQMPQKKKPLPQKPRPKPTLTDMAGHFTKAMVKWAGKGFKTVSKDEYIKRRKICTDCAGGWRCPHCGCQIWAKAALITETCPDKKW